ncbi:hypothetical protein CEE37_12690 [candidate division LCP-89 bacterium B3_LCP]|uniref:Glycoside hydrolase family 5 domain-containing protein n=1 Tax=candidate division LCP-89 bacterium B3_LCP TaxID=2012998 RepID=A0A532UTY2_UNCL8|nr:MAG: hypothetical protein CEE37_12690 [candidate division LCP-89 bacterium B3_LCP]
MEVNVALSKKMWTNFALIVVLVAITGIYSFGNLSAAKPLSEGSLPFLKVEGPHIVDDTGNKVFLKGINFGNWLLWEGKSLGLVNYAEHKLRYMMEERIDKEKVDLFFELIKKHLITKEDFHIAKAEGLNVIRLPFHHRYVKDEPTELDRAIEWAKEAGIYVILDFHAAPGSQAPDYFADSDGTAYLWDRRDHQEEFIRLWEILAKRYKNEPVIAGYEILNEPVAKEGWKVTKLYKETVERIRRIDPHHILFLDGNNYASDPSVLDPPFDDNVVYMLHDYGNSVREIKQTNKQQGWFTFRDRYKVPIMCSEFYISSDVEKYFESEDIHWAPWIYYKLSSKWQGWIHGMGRERRNRLDNIREEIYRLVENSKISDGSKEDIIKRLDKNQFRDLKNDISRLARKNIVNRAELEKLGEELRQIVEISWIDTFCDKINQMSPAELEELIQQMRERNSKQFTSDGFYE